jgi:hypothetical protein
VNILHHPAARLAAFASVVTAPVASVQRRRPVVLTDETPPPAPVITDDWSAPLAGLDVDALVASGELGYIDTASPAELTTRGLVDGAGQHRTIAASAARAADLAAELERRRAATVEALTDVLAVEHRAMQARAPFLADLDALGRAA